jgi:hypothetical protein
VVYAARHAEERSSTSYAGGQRSRADEVAAAMKRWMTLVVDAGPKT